ncbi:TolC family protein, partial [Desulfobacterales bacterium HSG17]|nr:TolC family protein [Desulfobacterales bacterium HSG17]
LAQVKQRHYMPEISAMGQYTYNVDKSGKGAESGLSIPGIDLPGPADDHEWSIALDISLPIYEGGARSADIKKIRADIRALENTKIRINQLIEQRTRSSIFNISRSWSNIFLSKKAADRAGKNLELVQAMYSQGKVTITALIDAQNNKLIQEQNSALAVYKYLGDLLEYQRSVAWFEYAKPPDQVDKMLERIREYIDRK